MADKIKVLFLSANPSNTSRLYLGTEIKEIGDSLYSALHRDSFELISEWALTVDSLQKALLRYSPHIVHFSGHGNIQKGIVLNDEYGKAHTVGKQPLTALFRILKDNIRIIVLNACHTEEQADAIGEVIDYTIGMNTTIADKAAVFFSASFYSALGFGRSVREAFDLAVNNLQMKFPDVYKTPVFRVREGASSYLIEQPADPRLAEILSLKQKWANELDPWKRYWLAISVGNIGGKNALETLRSMRAQESDEFALMGVEEALRVVS